MDSPSSPAFDLSIRRGRTPVAEQIRAAIGLAIADGRLAPNARLPSSRDLSVRLGVARGTVRKAFDQLAVEGLIVSGGAAGTWVSGDVAVASPGEDVNAIGFRRPMAGLVPAFSADPLPFQMGVPALDGFPARAWQRTRTRILRQHGEGIASYPDPRGEPELRAQIAAQLAIGRHLRCDPDQVIVTSGYRQGLALAMMVLGASGKRAWVEDPGFLIGRRALELAGVLVEPVPVDHEGIRVADGIKLAPDAKLAAVTPGQQAPTGVPLSSERRRQLLEWARSNDAWIIEDDYLSELQLSGRNAPALASDTANCRVIHVGTFSKTLSPAFGLGFLVPPRSLVDDFTDVAAMSMPAPERITQLALADFMARGAYIRHLRSMKLLYRDRAEALVEALRRNGIEATVAGMAAMVRLPDHADDVRIAVDAFERGIVPAPLSAWYANRSAARKGLLLSVANVAAGTVDSAVATLAAVLANDRSASIAIAREKHDR